MNNKMQKELLLYYLNSLNSSPIKIKKKYFNKHKLEFYIYVSIAVNFLVITFWAILQEVLMKLRF